MPPRALRADALIALALGAGTGLSVVLYSIAGVYDHPAPAWASAAYVLATALPLAFRRKWPEPAALIVAAAFIAGGIARVPELLFGNITLFLAIYSVGAWARTRRAANLTRGVIVAAMFLWLFLDLGIRFANPELLAEMVPGASVEAAVAISLVSLLLNLLYFAAAWAFGDRGWASARALFLLQERTGELAAERERGARQAVVVERLRIARELHDVVAHHVAVMGVQAGAARRVLDRDRIAAAGALTAVEESARAGVDELRKLLGTLRSEGDEPDDAAPASTLGVEQLDDLVAEVARAGRTIRYRTLGVAVPLAGTVGNTLYRIAQEALTNAIKHAAPTAVVDVRLRYLADEVELEITDSGGRAGASAPGTGLGLLGMRERVAAVGGRLETGHQSRGGYLVRATLPTGTA